MRNGESLVLLIQLLTVFPVIFLFLFFITKINRGRGEEIFATVLRASRNWYETARGHVTLVPSKVQDEFFQQEIEGSKIFGYIAYVHIINRS